MKITPLPVWTVFACACVLVLWSGCPANAAEEKPAAPNATVTITNAAPKPVAPMLTKNQLKAPPSLESPGWEKFFDGKTLTGWKITDFAGKGDVRVEDGQIILELGVMTGINWTNPLPRMNYELSLEARRVEGSDFFCGLTFPVGPDPCSLVVGGWGGGVVGLSSLDGQDAANNETTKYLSFEKGRWYHIRLRVLPSRIQAWIDQDNMVDVDTTDRKIGVRIEMEQSAPLGIATWSTTGAVRKIQVREL